jgi:hypothetical protein
MFRQCSIFVLIISWQCTNTAINSWQCTNTAISSWQCTNTAISSRQCTNTAINSIQYRRVFAFFLFNFLFFLSFFFLCVFICYTQNTEKKLWNQIVQKKTFITSIRYVKTLLDILLLLPFWTIGIKWLHDMCRIRCDDNDVQTCQQIWYCRYST